MSFGMLAQGTYTFLAKRAAGPFWMRRKQLQRTQWMNRRELDALQLKLLRRVVSHSYRTVPFYRRLMDDCGIREDSIKTLTDVERFPVLTKRDVLEAGNSIVSTKYPRWLLQKANTGGTTGTPMTIYRDLFSIGNEHAFVRRQWDWAGIGQGSRCAYLSGRLIEQPDRISGPLYRYDPVMKELILSTYHLSTETAKDYAQAMKDYRVGALAGYPSSVFMLARTCLDSSIEVRLRAVLTSSETLTSSMRNTIAEAFGCQVFDFYGSAERVCYIHTCEHGSYHVIPEYGLTELIPNSSSGRETYRIVSTGFWNLAMPLIRYELGDIVVKSNKTCLCGRQFEAIESIEGREGDVIRTSSGREFGAAALTHLLYGVEHIVESQIIQDSIGHITIEYVPSGKFLGEDFVNFKRLVARHLPSELKVDLRQVETVKKTSNGKVQPVVSKLAL